MPSLDAASGAAPNETHIVIAEVVRRVKCELADSFDDKLDDRNFEWLRNWTAKVDLQLQVTDSAGGSPSVSYTHYYPNAFIYSAGSELTNGNLIGYFQQTFVATAGVNYSEQAQRAETVSFTLSLQEIERWKANAKAPALRGPVNSGDACDATGRELRGNLGLKEWVDSALYPVATADLSAGIHPQAPEPPAPPSIRTRTSAELEAEGSKDETTPVLFAKRQIDAFQKAAAASYQDSIESQAAIATSVAGAQNAMQTTIAPYLPVLTDDVKRILANNMATLSAVEEYARSDIDNTKQAVRELADIERMVNHEVRQDAKGLFSTAEVRRAGELATVAKRFGQDAKLKKDKAVRIADGVVSFKPNPPIDGLLHSVQFIVTYGGSVSPVWTLLLWKGPGTLPGLSATGVRTNSLNIALGPTSEQTRLITNQLISNVGTHP